MILLLLPFSLFNYGILGYENSNPEVSYELIRKYKFDQGIRSVSISGDGSQFAIAGKGYVSYFKHEDNSSKWTFNRFKKGDLVDAMLMSRKGDIIAVGTERAYVHIFKTHSQIPYWSFKSDGPALCLDISNNGLVSVGTFFGLHYLLDINNKSVIWVYYYPRNITVLTTSISGNGEMLASGTSDGRINIFKQDSNFPMMEYKTSNFIFSLCSSFDGRIIAAGSNDSSIYCFDTVERTLKWRYQAGGSIRSVSMSDQGDYVVAGGYDGGIYVLDSQTGELVWNYWIGDKVKTVHVASDGTVVLVGGADKKLHIFNLQTGSLLGFVESNFWVTSISSSKDGSHVIFGSGDEAYLIALKKSLLEKLEINNGTPSIPLFVYYIVTPSSLFVALLFILKKRWAGKSI